MGERLERALELSGVSGQRLGEAGTSITFVPVDRPAEAVTLLLDRVPPEVSPTQFAEITVELDAEQAEQFIGGRLVLSTCLIQGRARCRGPIRKYLAVDPILRRLLANVEALEVGGR